MKVYVEEMPKSCITCKMCYFDSAIRHNKCSLNSIVSQNNYRDIDCPLQSIQDHDKEVRQQVCDEIRETADGLSYIDYDLDEKSVLFDTLKDILYQIEKGDKE